MSRLCSRPLAHRPEEGLLGKRLGDEVIGAQTHGLHRNLYTPVCSHHDHRDKRVYCLRRAFQDCQAVHLRHADVQEDRVRGHLAHQAQGLAGPGSGGDFDLRQSWPKRRRQALQHILFIINDEDSFP